MLGWELVSNVIFVLSQAQWRFFYQKLWAGDLKFIYFLKFAFDVVVLDLILFLPFFIRVISGASLKHSRMGND